MLVLHQFEISPFCDKIRRALRYKNLPFTVRNVPVVRTPLLKRIGPAGKLPVLEHDGVFISDSTDIAHHLDATWPDPPLFPADPVLRAQVHVFEDWADESLYVYEVLLRLTLPHNAQRWLPALMKEDSVVLQKLAPWVVPQLMKSYVRSQGLGKKPLDQVLRDVRRHVDAIDGITRSQSWLVGEALSLADLAVYAQMACINGTEEGSAMIESAPHMTAWMKRVEQATR